MNIGVFVLRDLSIAGGSLVRIVGITKYLQELGCNVTLFAPNSTPLLEGKVNFVKIPDNCIRASKSVEYAAFPFLWPLTLFPSDKRLLKLIKAHDIDLIHCHQHVSAYRLFKIQKKISVPIVFEIHGILKLQKGDTKRVEKKSSYEIFKSLLAEKNMFRRMNSVFVRTEYERQYIGEQFKIPTSKIHVVPDGADVEFLGLEVSPEEKQGFYQELDLSPKKKTIFFAGEFKMQSGVIDLLNGFKNLSAIRNDIQLILIGDGALMQEVKRIKEEYKLTNVALPGRVPREKFRLYQSIADIMVTPEIDSIYNNLGAPLKLFECLASLKPTIATRISSHLEIIKDGTNGYLVEPNDEKSIEQGILNVLNDPDSTKIGMNGRSTMVDRYSWIKFSKDAVKAYSSILSEQKN